MNSLFDFFYRKKYPIKYARRLGVKFGIGCRFINVHWGTEPYLIKLGNNVSLSNVVFINHDGGVWVLRDENPDIDVVKPIIIGNNVFIGQGSMILPGVIIGDNVVIGANSVVNKNIPSNCVYAGIPARFIKDITLYRKKILSNSDRTKNMGSTQKRSYYLSKFREYLK